MVRNRLRPRPLFQALLSTWPAVFLGVTGQVGAATCDNLRQSMEARFGNAAPSPYYLDAISGNRVPWAVVGSASSGSRLKGDNGLGAARNEYVSCLLGTDPTTDLGKEKELPAPHGRATFLAAYYQEQLARQLPTLRGTPRSAPVLVSTVLDAAAAAATDKLGKAPMSIAQMAIARGWDSREQSFEITRIRSRLTEVVKELGLSEQTRTFVASAAEAEISRQVSRSNGDLQKAAAVILAVQQSKSIGDAALRLGKQSVLAQPDVAKVAQQSSDIAELVKAARKVTSAYIEGAAKTSAQLEAMLKNDVQSAMATYDGRRKELDAKLGADFASLKTDAKLTSLIKAKSEIEADIKKGVAGAKASLSDANNRIAAAHIALDFENAAASLNKLTAVVGDINPEAARYVAAASTVASTVSQIAGVMAAGAMGPVGWVTIGMSVLQAGGNIGAMFGGGGQSQEASLMKALRDISRQLEDIRQLLFDQHRETMSVLEVQNEKLNEILRVVYEQLYKEYNNCSTLNDILHFKPEANADKLPLLPYLHSSQNPSGRAAIMRCAEFLTKPGQAAGDAAGTGGLKLSQAFSWRTATFKNTLDNAGNVKKEFGAMRSTIASINQAILNHEGRHKLVAAAATYAGLATEAAWNLQLSPAATWKDVDSRLQPAHPAPLSLADFNKQYKTSPLPGGTSVAQLTREPLAGPAALTVMFATSQLADAAEFISIGATDISVFADTNPYGAAAIPTATLATRRENGNVLLSNWSVIALAGLADSTLTRGEYLVPVVSKLLDWADEPVPCGPTDALCAKLGKDSMRLYLLAAQRLVREVPEFRANVAAWRVREHLGRSPELKPGGAAVPTATYARALEEPSDFRLQQLLPQRSLYRMRQSEAPSLVEPGEAPVGKASWYMRLSGECAGFEKLADIALNAKAACNGLNCGDAALTKLADGKYTVKSPLTDSEPELRSEDNDWDRKKARVCVIAPLPSEARILEDMPRSDSTNVLLMNASSNYLGQLGYYTRLRATADASVPAAIEMATFARPPSVGVWKPDKTAPPATAQPAKRAASSAK